MQCPLCKSTNINQYRMPTGPIWCVDCGFTAQKKELNNPFVTNGNVTMKKMETNTILHILRNPYGYSEDEIREVRLAAADEIERWKGAYENMKDWAVENGLDIMTYNR